MSVFNVELLKILTKEGEIDFLVSNIKLNFYVSFFRLKTDYESIFKNHKLIEHQRQRHNNQLK